MFWFVFLIKCKYKGDNSVKNPKGDSPFKMYPSGLLMQIILLHCVDVNISIVTVA